MKQQLNFGKEKGKLPLIHHPGEAQADFGTADFYKNGKYHSGKYLVLSFPHSNQGFPQLFYGENMECLLECLDGIFRHIGGVPTEIWFDNTKTIVTKIIMGGQREVTERFQRFCEHYGFKAVFTNCNASWEKCNVENKVGYERRNFLVPVPRFLNRCDFNRHLLTENDDDSNREHYLKEGIITELFREDQTRLLPLPDVPFNLEGHRNVKTNGWGKFT
jgi:transposase